MELEQQSPKVIVDQANKVIECIVKSIEKSKNIKSDIVSHL